MKTCNLSVATVVLGALAVSYAACAAKGQDNTVPGGTTGPRAGSSNGEETAGTTNGTAGAPPVTGSAGAVAHPAGGATASAGGGFNTGVGGTFTAGGRPGVGTAGSATGSSGGPGTTGGCKAAAGLVTELAIDDLEDGDNVLTPAGSRVGYWYTFNDGTGVQVPAPSALFKPTAPGSTTSPKFAATTSGPAFTSYGAGMGFDFNNTASKSCPYDASAYKGISFYAKANAGNMAMMALKAMIKIPATTATTADSGTCAAKCDDHFYLKPAPVLTTTWTKYSITFASVAQDGFGTVATFDKSKILAVQFQVAKDVKFDFSIDDIAFF